MSCKHAAVQALANERMRVAPGTQRMQVLWIQLRADAACVPQVLLPASVGAELMRQDASRNGAQLFELASTSGRSMHAGPALALSFSLPPSPPPSHPLCSAGLLRRATCMSPL